MGMTGFGIRARARRSARASCLAVVALAALLAGCSDGSASTSVAGAPSSEVSSLDCPSVISDQAWAPLGWPAGSPATEQAGRCERIADGIGQVTVGTRAVAGAQADRADNARSVYDEECTRLRDSGSYVAEPAEQLAPGQTACGLMIDDGAKTGVAELILLTPSDEVVQLRIAVVEPTTVNRVTRSFRLLTETALATF